MKNKKVLCFIVAFSIIFSCFAPLCEAKTAAKIEGTVLFSDDFESYNKGDVPKKGASAWSNLAASNPVCLFVDEENGNKILKGYRGELPDETESKAPRVDISVPTSGLTNLVCEFDVKSSGGKSKITPVIYNSADVSLGQVKFPAPGNYTAWTHIKLDFKPSDNAVDVYSNGELFATYQFPNGKITDDNSFIIRIKYNVYNDGSWAAMDNFVLSSTDKEIGGMITFDGSVNWEKVAPANGKDTGLTKVMRKTHPRIYVNDWNDIKNKIDSDERCRYWYEHIISSADSLIGAEPIKYELNVRNNLNDVTTSFRSIVPPLAAAYCLTKDKKYKDQLYSELASLGSWSDWGPTEYLCTAHVLMGFAIAYDWLYYDWSEEERANILSWVLKLGMTPAVYEYEGRGSNKIATKVNNWNFVCNGSNLMMAIALADEYPNVTEYIASHVADAFPNAFAEISEDGAYSEPMSYWNYGVLFLVKAMAALDSCLEDGASLPTQLDFRNVRGLSNTGDFPIYYNGTTSSFNYGDASNSITTSPILFYFANKYNKPEYAWYQLYMKENNDHASGVSGKDAVWSLLWFDPENVAAPENALPLDKFYSSSEQYGPNGMSFRGSWYDNDTLFAAMHAGDETTAHTSLDSGGFVLDWKGKRWVHMYGRTPLGSFSMYSLPNYHTKLETGGRYDYYSCRAEANNTIIFDPTQNMPDMDINYFTKVIKSESSENTAFGIIDMTSTNKAYKSAKRGMMITGNRDRLIIRDEIEANKSADFYWFANTDADIKISDDKKSALLEMDGDRMLVRITEGPDGAEIGAMPTEPLPTSPKTQMGAIDGQKLFIHIKNASSLKLQVEFTTLEDGEGVKKPIAAKPLDSWSVSDGAPETTSQSLGETVALMINSPNAYASGAKTFIDRENTDVVPIIKDDRTLVPVRFISENFGCSVGWDDKTRTVSVKRKVGTSEITLVLGSNEMKVDGKTVILDTTAESIGGRTMIPLRALVEALGKQVFWDNRGLILISDKTLDFDSAKIDSIISLLDTRIIIGGKDMTFFDSEIYSYDINVSGDAIPEVSVISSQPSFVSDDRAKITIGDKTYSLNYVRDPFADVLGSGSEGVISKLEIEVDGNIQKPDYQTYISIASAKSSIDWSDKYPMEGTYDGIINAETQNRWSADGVGNWISYDFGEQKTIHSVSVAGFKASSRAYTFNVLASNDGENWNEIKTGLVTQNGVDHTVFKLDDVSARYIKFFFTGSSNSTWMGITEVRFYPDEKCEADDNRGWNSIFYTGSVHGMAGDSFKITAKGYDAFKNEIPLNSADVTFEIADEKIAAVSDGVVTLKEIGKTTLKATTYVLGRKVTTTIDVEAE